MKNSIPGPTEPHRKGLGESVMGGLDQYALIIKVFPFSEGWRSTSNVLNVQLESSKATLPRVRRPGAGFGEDTASTPCESRGSGNSSRARLRIRDHFSKLGGHFFCRETSLSCSTFNLREKRCLLFRVPRSLFQISRSSQTTIN